MIVGVGSLCVSVSFAEAVSFAVAVSIIERVRFAERDALSADGESEGVLRERDTVLLRRHSKSYTAVPPKRRSKLFCAA